VSAAPTGPNLDAAALLLAVRAASVSLGEATLAVRARSLVQAQAHIRQALGRLVTAEAALAPLAERELRATKP